MRADQFEYDFVVSYASEDSAYAKRLYDALTSYGAKVFFAPQFQSDLWGKNLYEYLSSIYSKQGRFFIPLISQHYVMKAWTRHEWKIAQERVLANIEKDYLLPIRIDDTELPGLPRTIAYLDVRRFRVEEIAKLAMQKLDAAKNATPFSPTKSRPQPISPLPRNPSTVRSQGLPNTESYFSRIPIYAPLLFWLPAAILFGFGVVLFFLHPTADFVGYSAIFGLCSFGSLWFGMAHVRKRSARYYSQQNNRTQTFFEASITLPTLIIAVICVLILTGLLIYPSLPHGSELAVVETPTQLVLAGLPQSSQQAASMTPTNLPSSTVVSIANEAPTTNANHSLTPATSAPTQPAQATFTPSDAPSPTNTATQTDTATKTPTSTNTPTNTVTPPPAYGTILNPVPIGDTAKIVESDTEAYTVTIKTVYRGADAWQKLIAANQFNKTPSTGTEFLLIYVVIAYVKGDIASQLTVTEANFITYSQGHVIRVPDAAVPPDPNFIIKKLRPTDTVEGWIVLQIYTGDNYPEIVFGDNIPDETLDPRKNVFFAAYPRRETGAIHIIQIAPSYRIQLGE